MSSFLTKNLTFITDQIVVIQNIRAKEHEFFSFYTNHYKIFHVGVDTDNLIDNFENVEYCYPNQVNSIHSFVKSANEFLQKGCRNIVVINNDSGLFTLALLLNRYKEEAAVYLNKVETIKLLPSYYRFISYPQVDKIPPLYMLKKVTLNTVPTFDFAGGCNPYMIVTHFHQNKKTEIFSKKDTKEFPFYSSTTNSVELEMSCIIYGDVQISFYDHDELTSDDKMFTLLLNSNYLSEKMSFCLKELDEVQPSHFKENFSIDFEFEKVADEGENIFNRLLG